jgi:hypothetical protein
MFANGVWEIANPADGGVNPPVELADGGCEPSGRGGEREVLTSR